MTVTFTTGKVTKYLNRFFSYIFLSTGGIAYEF